MRRAQLSAPVDVKSFPCEQLMTKDWSILSNIYSGKKIILIYVQGMNLNSESLAWTCITLVRTRPKSTGEIATESSLELVTASFTIRGV